MDHAYRDRIYKNYATNFQFAEKKFNHEKAWYWGRAYKYYFRNWFPSSDAQILDVACGGGRLLYTFKKMGFQNITGVDISPEQVQLSKQVIQNVFEENSLNFLENNPAKFDLITGLDIVEHFNKNEVMKFLDACFSALKPGGRLILQTPNAESPWGSVHRYNDITHELGFNPNAMECLLNLTGFSQTESREMGPIPFGHSMFSSIRYVLWQFLRLTMKVWNLIETGAQGGGVFTRVFFVTGKKD